MSEVLGAEWNDCSVDKAVNWEGSERREVEIAVCGFCGSFGMGGRRGSLRGWRSLSQVLRSSCSLEYIQLG